MLRKPNKKDPFSPRSYRPITLEETLGKLLEKMIANRLQFLANTRGWLPPNQFGGRQGHSVYDAAQHLLQIVVKAHAEAVSYKQPLPSFVGTLAKRSQGLRV